MNRKVEQGGIRFLESLEVPAFIVDPDGRVRFANPSWVALVGEPGEAAWSWLQALAPDDRDRVRRGVEHALRESRGAEIEFHARRCDGASCVLAVVLTRFAAEGDDTGLVGFAWDVTERRRQEQRLAFMAGHDPLTGLANRRAFEESLQRSVSRAARGSTSVLLLLDLDHLKAFNDAHGHLEGDQALVNFALLLRSNVRAADLAARIGGDEFAVLLEDASAEKAAEIAARIAVASETDFVAGARESDLGVSGGLASVEGGVDPRVVMDRADAALYAAKERGRHRIVTWESDLGGLATPDRLAGRVRDALAENGFSLVFQPVVRLSDGTVSYYESCVRLQTLDGEVLSAKEFLPVVERLGLMPRLTRLVFEQALAAATANPEAAVAVNLSASDLADDLLLDDVETAIDASGFDPSRIVLEIAEHTMLAERVSSEAWMERLAPRGCRFVLDDFGTGLGVFVLLREGYIEQVKLSATVVRAISDSAHSRSFVEAVRELVESQGKIAVAAFVETDELLADVRDVGFQYGQGYCLREPSADLRGLIAEMSSKQGPIVSSPRHGEPRP